MLQFAAQYVPFISSETLANWYKKQFPDQMVATIVSLGSTEMSYLVSCG